MLSTFPVLHDLLNLIMYVEEYKLYSSVSLNFLQPPVASSNNIKMDPKHTGSEGMNYTHAAQGRIKWYTDPVLMGVFSPLFVGYLTALSVSRVYSVGW
jgi:hypothetical protein